MDGRVKTLHPKVHGGLLAVRGDSAHENAMAAHGIAPIDLLVEPYPLKRRCGGRICRVCGEHRHRRSCHDPRRCQNHTSVTVVVERDDYSLY
jgi:phosphoribosylaminoimidazolecarboxamide formyltransferase/IMP cyclohydrolase